MSGLLCQYHDNIPNIWSEGVPQNFQTGLCKDYWRQLTGKDTIFRSAWCWSHIVLTRPLRRLPARLTLSLHGPFPSLFHQKPNQWDYWSWTLSSQTVSYIYPLSLESTKPECCFNSNRKWTNINIGTERGRHLLLVYLLYPLPSIFVSIEFG